MKPTSRLPVRVFGIVFAIVAILVQPARGQITETFTGATSDDYATSSNWSGNTVPDLTTDNTAVINNGDAVTYNAGSDFIIKNGGTLEVSNGSWTQINGGNWIQLNGNGNILVDGGTFNQGSSSSSPFNIEGSGNTFTISSGVANVNGPFQVDLGLTYDQTGGTVNTTGEFDFDADNTYMSGGVINTTLITGVNNLANDNTSEMFFSGGLINMSSSTGIYGGSPAAAIDFELDSTGELSFNGGTTASAIEGMVNQGSVIYNGAEVAYSSGDFVINNVDGDNVLELAPDLQSPQAVPEPSTYALLGAGVALLALHLRRRKLRGSV